MSRRPLTAVALAAALLGAAIPAAAGAQTTTTTPAPTQQGTTSSEGTVAIDACHVKRSRNAGGFTWAYCGITSDLPAGTSGSVTYTSNLPTFIPRTGGSFDARTGRYGISDGGGLWTVKFAFRNRSVAQVRQSLRVTLSNPVGVTITDGTATASAN